MIIKKVQILIHIKMDSDWYDILIFRKLGSPQYFGSWLIFGFSIFFEKEPFISQILREKLDMHTLHRILARKQIRLPRIIETTRWLSMSRKLSENDLNVENEVHIRPGGKEDLDFLVRTEDKSDPGYHMLLQATRWWDHLGFRCLYVGYLENQSAPCILEYWIEDSDNHRFKQMEYGGLYQPLDSVAVQAEGAYVCKDMRGKELFPKLLAKGYKLFYQRGKKVFHAHALCRRTGISTFKMAKKSGYVPGHWITIVRINLPFFRSRVFVHQEIKDSERDKFPLTLFDRGSQ